MSILFHYGSFTKKPILLLLSLSCDISSSFALNIALLESFNEYTGKVCKLFNNWEKNISPNPALPC